MCEKNTTDGPRQSDQLKTPTKKKTMDMRKKTKIHNTENRPGGQKCKKKIPSLLKLNVKMNATPEEKLLERKKRFQLPDSDCGDLIKRKVPIKARLSKKPEQRRRRTGHKEFREIHDGPPVSYILRRRELGDPRLRVGPLIAQPFKRQKIVQSAPEPEPSVSIIIDYNHKDKDTEHNIEEHKKDQQNIIEDTEAFTRRQNKKANEIIPNTNGVSDSCNNCVQAKANPVNVKKVNKGQNLNYNEIQKIRSRRRSQVLEALHKTEKRISRRKIGVWITNRPDPPKEIESYGPSPCVGFDQYELQEFYYYQKMDEENHFKDHEFGDADAETELSDWSSTSTSTSTSSPRRADCNNFTETQISSTCKTSVDFDILKSIKLEPLTETETEIESDAEIGKVPPIRQKHADASKPNRPNIQIKKKTILNKKRLKVTKINPPNPLPTPTTVTTTAVAVYNPNSNPSSKEKEMLEETRAASLSLRLRHFITKLNLMAINREKKLWLPRKLDLDNFPVVKQCDSNVTIKVEIDDDLKKEQNQNYPDEDLPDEATAGLKLEGSKKIEVPH